MITPARIANRYRSVEPYLEPLRTRIRDSLLTLCERKGYAHASRIKSLESVAEKIETGRFARWVDLDDLVAFTVVVPTLSEEIHVTSFLKDTFETVALRPRGSSHKAPDVFRFDSTRFIGRLAMIGEYNRSELYGIPFEVQVKSAFEHAWSVATHDLAYKSPVVSWRRLRLTAQLKAAVEQLDTLILAFETASDFIEPSAWPEISAKAELRGFLDSLVTGRHLPIELTPKDWSRYIDNIYRLLQRSGIKQPHEISMAVQAALQSELDLLGAGNVPMSLSLWQLSYASLLKAGAVKPDVVNYWPLITPELEELYPSVRAIARRFDYA